MARKYISKQKKYNPAKDNFLLHNYVKLDRYAKYMPKHLVSKNWPTHKSCARLYDPKRKRDVFIGIGCNGHLYRLTSVSGRKETRNISPSNRYLENPKIITQTNGEKHLYTRAMSLCGSQKMDPACPDWYEKEGIRAMTRMLEDMATF